MHNKAKVTIDYPPVTTRKWRPPPELKHPDPHKRPKFKRLPYFPHTKPLSCCPIDRVWRYFLVLNKNVTILHGTYSKSSPRFIRRNRGFQGPGCCVGVVAMAYVIPMDHWTDMTVDAVIELGNKLYEQNTTERKICRHPQDIGPNFFVGETLFKMGIYEENNIHGRLFQQKEKDLALLDALFQFFRHNKCCILEVGCHIMITIWKSNGVYYCFDPESTDLQGLRTKYDGPASILRTPNLHDIMARIVHNMHKKLCDVNFIMTATEVRRTETPWLNPPVTLEDLGKAFEQVARALKGRHISRAATPELEEEELDEDGNPVVKPILPAPIPSTTHFVSISGSPLHILRSNYHQHSSIWHHRGKLELASALVAIAALRMHRSRRWGIRQLDAILATADYRNDDLTDLVALAEKVKVGSSYWTVRLGVEVPGWLGGGYERLGMADAIDELFTECDSCIMKGPTCVAIWREEGRYYMFDCNERDAKGRVIRTCNPDDPEGCACLVWGSTIQDLAYLYTKNTPREKKRSYFRLIRTQVVPYVDLPDMWNNFEALTLTKWILRGTFSQSDYCFQEASRNTQCTVNAIVSLCHKIAKPVAEWGSDDIDRILVAGDQLYNETVAQLVKKGTFKEPMLYPIEIAKTFWVVGQEYTLDVDECLVNGILTMPDDGPVPNLKRALQIFFEDNDDCVISCNHLTVAVWKEDDVYFYFDSHGRNAQGYRDCIGTACIMRLTELETLAEAIHTNLEAAESLTYNMFNITNVTLVIVDEIYTIPPNFDGVGIIRAKTDTGVDNLTESLWVVKVAAAMAVVIPMLLWNQATVDEIMATGREMCREEQREALRKLEAAKTSEGGGESTETAAQAPEGTVVNIGLNRCTISILEATPCMVDPELSKFVKYPDLSEKLQAKLEDPDVYICLLRTENLNLCIWMEGKRCYLFDPAGRDEEGKALGAEMWSELILEWGQDEEEEEEEKEEERGGAAESLGKAGKRDKKGKKGKKGKKEGKSETEDELEIFEEEEIEEEEAPKPRHRGCLCKQRAAERAAREAAEGEDGDGDGDGRNVNFRMGQFDDDMEGEDEETDEIHFIDWTKARTCVTVFPGIVEAVAHVKDNIRPKKRVDPVQMCAIKIVNRLKLKKHTDAIDWAKGNWHKYQELELGRWILRGTISLRNAVFPPRNRGWQHAAAAVVAALFAQVFTVSAYETPTVDRVVQYGDRMHTSVIRQRMGSLAEMGLTAQEMECILADQPVDPTDLPTYLAVGITKIKFTVELVIEGDLTAKESQDIPNMQIALANFFEEYTYGVFTAKRTSVAIFYSGEKYFMFDPDERGPSGLRHANGVACYLRFDDLSDLWTVLEYNLPQDGLNTFRIYTVTVVEITKRETLEELEVPRHPPNPLSPYRPINPSTQILMGSIHQDTPGLARRPGALAAVAVAVSIAMRSLYRSSIWTRPVVDRILTMARRLYECVVTKFGDSFNAWVQKVTVEMMPKRWRVGGKEVKLQLGEAVFGVMTGKGYNLVNLRSACDKMFRVTDAAIIISDCLTLGIWRDKPLYYMYDPSPRGPTGLRANEGASCVISFTSPTALIEHCLADVSTECREMEFTLVPIEITLCGPGPSHAKMLRDQMANLNNLNMPSEERTAKNITKKPCKRCPRKMRLPPKRDPGPPGKIRPPQKWPPKEILPIRHLLYKEKVVPRTMSGIPGMGRRGTASGASSYTSLVSQGITYSMRSCRPKGWKRGPCTPRTGLSAPRIRLSCPGDWPTKPKKPTCPDRHRHHKTVVRHDPYLTRRDQKTVLKKSRIAQALFLTMCAQLTDIGDGFKLLRCRYSFESNRYASLGSHHSMCFACVALALAKLHCPSSWTGFHLETALDSAAALHRDSRLLHKDTEADLEWKHVPRSLHVGGEKMWLKMYEPWCSGTVNDDMAVPIGRYFALEYRGIFQSGAINIAISRTPVHEYYVWEPWPRDDRGGIVNPRQRPPQLHATACLIFCPNLMDAVDRIMLNHPEMKEGDKFCMVALEVDVLCSKKKKPPKLCEKRKKPKTPPSAED